MSERIRDHARLMEGLARVITRLTDAELDAFLAGDFRLEIGGRAIAFEPDETRPPGRAKGRAGRPRRPQPTVGLDEAVATLRGFNSMERGRQFLEEQFPRLDALRSLVQHLRMPQSRGDDAESLSRKILIQTIGSRINREAIRGDDGSDATRSEQGNSEPTARKHGEGDTGKNGGLAPPAGDV